MEICLHPVYLPNILTFAHLLRRKTIWEVWDNYQKQTFRNRCYVATDQGRQIMSIPVKHVGGNQGRQAYRDVKIDNSYPWQRQHWRTLQTAYRSSPFFEYFEDEIAPVYDRRYDYLMEFNLVSTGILCRCLGVEMPGSKTKSYQLNPGEYEDFRYLVSAKRDEKIALAPYTQVFAEKHGFISNLSILDLIFNLGLHSLDYLREIELRSGK